MTGPQQTIGIGYAPISGSVNFAICNFDFGSTTGIVGAPQANSIPADGGQQMATNAVAHSPLTNETGVDLTMAVESPNPVPSVANPGRPILIRVNAANPGDVLTVASFTLTPAGGSRVVGTIMVPAGAQAGSTNTVTVDPNGILGPGVVAFVPSGPLNANTVYTVDFNGARDGRSLAVTYQFTTGN